MNHKNKDLKKKKWAIRKSTDPFHIEFIGDQYLENPDLQLFIYNKDDFQEINNIDIKHIPDFTDPDKVYWLNVNGIHETELIKNLGIKHGLDQLVLGDILDTTERPKMQDYEDYLFFTIKSILPLKGAFLEVEQISFVLGRNYVLSFQERKSDHFEHIRNKIRQDVGFVRERSADFLLYLLLGAILDNYFSTIDNMEMEIYELTGMEESDPDPEIVRQIEEYKKLLFHIKRSLQPHNESNSALGRGISDLISPEHHKYFTDLHEQSRHLLENIEVLNMRLESGLNLFYSLQGHKMSQIMKTLTVIATIFIPLTFVAGVYGMNFRNMPELYWEWGYFTVWTIMLIMVIGMMFWFKKKKWF